MKYLIFLICLISTSAWARPIAISDPHLNSLESLARIQSLNAKAYSEFIMEKLKSRAEKKNLVQKATELRLYELNENHEKIHSLCSGVFKIRHDADWGPSDRFFINRCLVHLSHLSSDPRTQASMKLEAQAFSTEPQEKLSIPSEIYENYEWVLINGKAFSTRKRVVELPQKKFRMSLLSSRFLPVTMVIRSQNLQNIQNKKKPLITGNCQSGFRYESRHLDSIDIHNTTVVSKDCKLPLMSSHPIETKFVTKKGKFEIPTWAWWIAGGLVGYAVYENSQNNQGGSSPTTKRGF